MERLLRIYGVVLRVVIIVVLFLLALEFLAEIVAWYWPCDWAWQPFAPFNPRCTGGETYTRWTRPRISLYR
jgi:hypothetical protein